MKTRSLLFSLALLVAATAPSFAADLSSLNVIPADSVTVGIARVSELRDSSLGRRIFAHADDITLDGEAADFLTDAGFNPMTDIDSITFSLSPNGAEGNDGDALLVLQGRFDVERLSNAISTRGGTRVPTQGGAYFRFTRDMEESDEQAAVALVSRTMALAGEEDAVVEALAALARGGTDFANAGGLAHLISRVDTNASAWLLVDVPRSARLKGHHTEVPGDQGREKAFHAALKNVSTVGLWADENGDSIKLGATAESTDEETLILLEDLLRGMLATWRLAAQEKAPELVAEIRRFAVSRSGDRISLTGELSADLLEKFTARGPHTATK